MTIWQQRIIEVREKAQAMKQEALRLRECSYRYHASDVSEILFAWANEIEVIVSPRRAAEALVAASDAALSRVPAAECPQDDYDLDRIDRAGVPVDGDAMYQRKPKRPAAEGQKHHPACDPGWGPRNYRCHPDCKVGVPAAEQE